MFANVRHAQKDTIVNHLVNKLPQINVHLDSTARQGLVLSMQTHALWDTTEMPLRQLVQWTVLSALLECIVMLRVCHSRLYVQQAHSVPRAPQSHNPVQVVTTAIQRESSEVVIVLHVLLVNTAQELETQCQLDSVMQVSTAGEQHLHLHRKKVSLEVFVQKEAIAQGELKSALLAQQGNTTMKLVQNRPMIVFCVQQGITVLEILMLDQLGRVTQAITVQMVQLLGFSLEHQKAITL